MAPHLKRSDLGITDFDAAKLLETEEDVIAFIEESAGLRDAAVTANALQTAARACARLGLPEPRVYPAVFEPDEDAFVVTFPDIPEAITQGDGLQEAREMARDALVTALDFYFDDGRRIPEPSPVQPHHAAIVLPADVAARVREHNGRI
jgi:predicted RNase H-like HicB family nuclease